MKKTLIILTAILSTILVQAQNNEKQNFCNMFQEHLEQLYKTTKVTYESATIIVTMDLKELAKFSEISITDARGFVSDKDIADKYAKTYIEMLGAYNSAEREVVNSFGFYSLKAVYKDDYSHQYKKYSSSPLTFYK